MISGVVRRPIPAWLGAAIVAMALSPVVAQEPAARLVGQLDRNSQKLRTGEFVAVHEVQVAAGAVFTARLSAKGFAPYLVAILGEDLQLDHSGAGGTAQVAFALAQAGVVRFLVTTVQPGETGSYELLVNEGYLDGELRDGDRQLDSGELTDTMPIWVPAGVPVTCTIVSEEFDTYLIGHAGEDVKIDVDDSLGFGTSSQLVLPGEPRGARDVQVTTFQPGEKGAYRLFLSLGTPSLTDTIGTHSQLRDGDQRLTGGEFYDTYTFFGEAGKTYTISCTSDTVDTYLIVRDASGGKFENDDFEGSTNATIVLENPADGMIVVMVTSARAGEQGEYLVQVTPGGRAAQRTLLSQAGRLDTNDRKLRTGEYYDTYEVEVPANQRITVRLSSTEFDAYLIAQVPGLDDQLDNDDERSGSTDARLSVTPAQAGTMTIGVTSALAGETGAYTLSVVAEAEAEAPAETATLRVGQTIRGSLAQGDSTLDSGEYYDLYTLEGDAGQAVTVTMHSEALDSYLVVIPPGASAIDNDDAEGLGLDARITFQFAQAGVCRVVATSSTKGESGAYTIAAEAAQQTGPRLGEGGTIEVGNFVDGTLAEGDERLSSGEYYDLLQFDAAGGEVYTIDLVSSTFDPYLMVVAPDSSQQENDNEGASQNSRLELRSSRDGRYQIVVTSAKPGESGAYTVGVRGATTTRLGGGGGAAVLTGDGTPIEGRLEEGDGRLTSGELSDAYTIELRAGQWLEVAMNSDEVDPYLIVQRPDGEQEENDDAVEGNPAAAVKVEVKAAGQYRVLATTYQPGEQGKYVLRATVTGSAPTPTTDGGERRYWGVFAGINDYPRAPLQFCAEDAERMSALFAQMRLVPESQRRVLVNRQATVANVRQALLDIGRQAGPKDMLMFFYSGHGGQTEDRPESKEADLREEFLYLIDGPLMDDELAGVLDQVRPGLTLVYLDACFSGGFAKDIIVRPGRMGIFSSDEDLTSNVAGKFRAGGYLSHFMLKAVEGAADQDRDKVITAAELSYYLEDRFTSECHDVDSYTREDQRGYQRVRIDRGGVKLATPLFLLP